MSARAKYRIPAFMASLPWPPAGDCYDDGTTNAAADRRSIFVDVLVGR
jgi:hypothetical protein